MLVGVDREFQIGHEHRDRFRNAERSCKIIATISSRQALRLHRTAGPSLSGSYWENRAARGGGCKNLRNGLGKSRDFWKYLGAKATLTARARSALESRGHEAKSA